MAMFANRSAGIYDDVRQSTLATRALLARLVGDEEEGPAASSEKHIPYLNSPQRLVTWLGEAHEAEPLLTVVDLHDASLKDLGAFNQKRVGTDSGQLTGWRVVRHVIFPRMLSGEIPRKTPIIFVSSRPEALEKARNEAEHAPDVQAAAREGIRFAFLEKPTNPDDMAARELWREAMRIATAQLAQAGPLEQPFLEMGLGDLDCDVDHLNLAKGLQAWWDLSDDEMAKTLYFESTDAYQAFRTGTVQVATGHWKDHTKLLFSLASHLASAARTMSREQRRAYQRQWLRETRPALRGLSPLGILLSGDMNRLQLLLDFLEGAEIDDAAFLPVST